MTKIKQTEQNNNKPKALLLSFLTVLVFSVLWGFLYYFLALPNYLGIAQYIVAFVVYKTFCKDSKCHLWLAFWCLVLNFLTLFVAIIVGIYAETGSLQNAFTNFVLLFQNSKPFALTLFTNSLVILGTVIVGCCVLLVYFELKLLKKQNKEAVKKSKKTKEEIDHFITLYMATKKAIDGFLLTYDLNVFKKQIFYVEQKIAGLKAEDLLAVKTRIDDAISMPNITKENRKALDVLKKIADKY